MDTIEFNRMCRPLNKEYRDIFGKVPCPADYACSQDEYYEALQKALQEKKPLEEYLEPVGFPSGNVLR